ncbi:MAG: hypothetical protein JXA77_09410 [Bacteroidales bacterium]|nr:hypothetical protein [Bacteroidales bacterium]MBN2817386.1 hypothetical protein [Bacteroidales bacterium]
MEKKIKALFVGLNTIDLQFFVNQYPKSNTKTKAHHNEISTGGPAANAAITAAHLGAEVTLITPIGKHRLTSFLKGEIGSFGINLIDPIQDFNSNPVFASIITDESNGERTIFSYMPPNSTEHFIEKLNHDFSKYDIALFDGFYPVMSELILKELNKHHIPTVFDGGSWKKGLDKILPYIDIAVCSDDFYPSSCITKKEVFKTLKSFSVEKMAITQGEKPILIYDNEKITELPVVKQQDVKDTLGAGDIFHGAFCYFYAKSHNFNQALAQASEVAGFSCKFTGTRSWMEHKNELNIAL